MSAIQQMLMAGSGTVDYVLPTFVNSNTNSTTSSSFPLFGISGAVADDIVLIFTYTNGTSCSVAGAQSAGSSGKVNCWWLRLTGSDPGQFVAVNGHGAGVIARGIKILVRGASLDATPIVSTGAGSASGTSLYFGTGGSPLVNNTLYASGGYYITTAASASASGFSGSGKTNVSTKDAESFAVSGGGTGYMAVVIADCVDSTTGGNILATTSQAISSGGAFSVKIKGLPA